MVYSERMQKALVGRAGDWLTRQSLPRLTMTLAVAVGTMASMQCADAIVGVRSLGLRFPACFLAGYVGYLATLGAWYLCRSPVNSRTLLQDAPPTIRTAEPWSANLDDDGDPQNPFSSSDADFWRQMRESTLRDAGKDVPGALIAFLLSVAFLGAILVGVHRIVYAPWYLGELLVLGGKVRHETSSAPPAQFWAAVLFWQSRYEAIALCVHYVLLGLLLQLVFPNAATMSDVFRFMR